MPEPSLYNPIGSSFVELGTIDSTNNYALSAIHEGLAQHGTAVFAHEQVAGKGRRGKTWLAEKGNNLILSMVINPSPLLPTQQFQLSACVAVSALQLFQKLAGEDTRIKWPNDLYWQDRKAGGILIESIIGAGSWKWAVAGIGININQVSFAGVGGRPVSLRQITGRQHDAPDLARQLCAIMDANWQQLLTAGFDNIYELYQQNLYKRGELVRLRHGSRNFDGLIKGVSRDGRLQAEHGLEESFATDEVEWIFPDPDRSGNL